MCAKCPPDPLEFRRARLPGLTQADDEDAGGGDTAGGKHVTDFGNSCAKSGGTASPLQLATARSVQCISDPRPLAALRDEYRDGTIWRGGAQRLSLHRRCALERR